MTRFIMLLFGCIMGWIQIHATNYYINSQSGLDEHPGTSRDSAWQTLDHLNTRIFLPGDSILFAKGSFFNGGFVFIHSGTAHRPIVFTSYSAGAEMVLANDRKKLAPLFLKYGAGQAPRFTNPDWKVLNGNIFKIEGSHIVIDGLYFHDNANPPGSNKTNQNVQKLGVIYFGLSSSHNVVKNCEFVNTPVGVKLKGTQHLVSHNYFHDTYRMMAESWGPIAIMVVGSHHEIAFNRVENYGAYGGPYGSDGGVIELDGVDQNFDAHHIHIHHNRSINNHGFLEIAARNVKAIIVAYNLSDDKNQFIGGGGFEVKVFNNTVIRMREPNVDRYVFWTFSPEQTFFELRNNIFYIASDMAVLGPVKKVTGHARVAIGDHPRSHNIFYSPGNARPVGIPVTKSDWVQDPQFIDMASGNFRLKRGSPASGTGQPIGYSYDLDGYPVSSQKPGLGAYEAR